MKTSLLAFFVLYSLSTYANNYYFSSSVGDDNRTSLEAQNPSTPWMTLNKLNSFFGNLQPGDQILLKRGDVFYGSIKITNSGSSSNPIVFDTYGNGSAPVITGFKSVASWQNLGKNVWESSAAISSLQTTNMVLVKGVNTPMGRYPNSGYLTYQTFNGNTSITSSSINSSTTNWTGAEAVIKKTRWIIDRRRITSHSGGTLVYSGGGNNGRAKYGFFIQNDTRTLDKQNEWFYNASTKKLRIYSTSSPVNVQVATIDTLVEMIYSNYVTFNNISFTGANDAAFLIGGCRNVTLQNCDLDFCYNGISGKNFGASSASFVMQNCSINHSNNNGVALSDEFANATFTNNDISNIALIPGAGASGDGTYTAINIQSSNCIIKYNNIDEVGYNGITFFGNSINVSHNMINRFCLVKSDGGGIYTQGVNSDMIISDNIVINGVGNVEGVYNPVGVGVIGIYCDGNVNDIQILNNSVANIKNAGIYLHNPVNVRVKNNTVYNCTYASFLMKNDDNSIFVRDLILTDNIFVARDASQLTSQIITLHNDVPSLGTFDNNYYARPIDDNKVVGVQSFGENVNSIYYNFSQWKSYSQLDANSLKSPKTITNLNDLRFEYNAGTSEKTVSLDASYIDVTGKTYKNSLVLQPFTSVVLIKAGTGPNAAPNVAITSPVDNTSYPSPASITITATASDDGSVSKVDFYRGSSLVGTDNTNPYSVTLNNVGAGGYSFTAKATDNAGLTSTSAVVFVLVTGTGGGAPTVSLISPNNNTIYKDPAAIVLTAVASDDGSIAKVELFNGTTLLNTQKTSPYTFTWSNVHKGNYTLTAKATDNNGLTTTSAPILVSVTATGGPSGNAPTVNLISPSNNATFSDPAIINITASASDNGTISKVELFSGATLLSTQKTSPYAFNWQNVHTGTYTITAKATDNDGLTTTSAPVSVSVTGGSGGAPVISMISPVAGATYKVGATIVISATASDNGTIKKVEFFNGSTLLNTQGTSPYSFNWANVKAGNYSLTARATDNSGLTTTTPAVLVSVTVNGGSPSSGAPVVNITAPKDKSTFNKGATINLTAVASDNGSIKKVEFFSGSTLLNAQGTAPYSFDWKSVPSGSYTITAKATDNSGLVTTSSAIHITVKAQKSSGSSSSQVSINANDKLSNPWLSQFMNFRLLPDPAINMIQLDFDALQIYRRSVLTIYNALGVIMKKYPVIISGKKIDVDISSLKPGIYFIALSGDNFMINKKFVKVN